MSQMSQLEFIHYKLSGYFCLTYIKDNSFRSVYPGNKFKIVDCGGGLFKFIDNKSSIYFTKMQVLYSEDEIISFRFLNNGIKCGEFKICI